MFASGLFKTKIGTVKATLQFINSPADAWMLNFIKDCIEPTAWYKGDWNLILDNEKWAV